MPFTTITHRRPVTTCYDVADTIAQWTARGYDLTEQHTDTSGMTRLVFEKTVEERHERYTDKYGREAIRITYTKVN